MKINSFGDFNVDGIRILERFHRLKHLCDKISYEKKWIKTTFEKNLLKKKWHTLCWTGGTWKVPILHHNSNYRIMSQELSLLCGERYLSDEILNFLGKKFCDRANDKHQSCLNILLPSFLSSGNIINLVVSNMCQPWHGKCCRNVSPCSYAERMPLGTSHFLY